MADPQLPDDLQQLESVLSRRVITDPFEGHRDRVLRAMREAATEAPTPITPSWWTGWRFAAAAAVAAVLWINLSMSLCAMPTLPRMDSNGEQVHALAEQIGQLLPELSESECRRQAALMHAGSRLVPMPRPVGGALPTELLDLP